MLGHVLLVSRDAAYASKWADSTANWLLKHGLDPDPVVYVCHDIKLAEKSITLPLADASPPMLVILDHMDQDERMVDFSNKLRDCIPETWIVDLIPREGLLPKNLETAHILSKPIHQEDWDELFHLLFFQAANPQWSRTLMAPDSL